MQTNPSPKIFRLVFGLNRQAIDMPLGVAIVEVSDAAIKPQIATWVTGQRCLDIPSEFPPQKY
jgi:hypothetical protein